MPFININSASMGVSVVIAILGIASVIALALVLLKCWQWWGVNLDAPLALQRVTAGESSPTEPLEQVLNLTLQARADGASDAAVSEIYQREGAACLERYGIGLRTLELISHLAPLLGLFGTVLGMIDAFQALEAATGPVDPSALSGGIWAALTTTAVGLAVAIPVMVAFSVFDQRRLRLAYALDQGLSRVLVSE